jgi:hypothetical protein
MANHFTPEELAEELEPRREMSSSSALKRAFPSTRERSIAVFLQAVMKGQRYPASQNPGGCGLGS